MGTSALVSLEEYLASIYEPDAELIDGQLEERHVGELDHSIVQSNLAAFLIAAYRSQGFTIVTECRIQVKPDRVRIPDVSVFLRKPSAQVPTEAPFLCIEILSPEDRMSRLEARIKDYLEMGVAYVWVIDPQSGQCYRATAAAGLNEVKTGVLTTTQPTMEVPLADVLP
jgi:Uma2 family endonuclease